MAPRPNPKPVQRPPLPFPLSAAGIVTALAVTALPSLLQGQAVPITTSDLESFEPRIIGPAVTGGRITDLTALPDDPSTIYVATASGGIWKSTTRGHQWTPIFDDQPVSTFGDIAYAPSDPDILYAGTGEQNNRQSASWGDGVYRSDDAGATWSHAGLVESRHIGKIEVHPDDPDVVYVAALGNLWAPNEERGVFRSTDGGGTWMTIRGLSTSSWTPRTPTSCTPPPTSGCAERGASTGAAREAESGRRRTGATRGPSSAAACPKATRAASDWPSPKPVPRS